MKLVYTSQTKYTSLIIIPLLLNLTVIVYYTFYNSIRRSCDNRRGEVTNIVMAHLRTPYHLGGLTSPYPQNKHQEEETSFAPRS